MTSQLQILNKILQTKDFSIVTLNNLTEDYFYSYKAEFNFIKNHYDMYHNIPDKLTFVGVFPDFDIIEVTEPDSYLLEQLYTDYNTSYLITRFNNIKQLIESDNTPQAIDYFLKSVDNLHQGSALSCTDLMTDTSRYDRYIERTTDQSKYYISTGFPELDAQIGGIDRENENMVIAARTGIGKSWTLIKMAVAASKQGLTVGIFSGEMTADKVGYRVDTLLGHINNKDIMRGNAYSQAKYKQYIVDLASLNYGPIKVVTPADIAGESNVPALQAFIEKEHLDILFVDQYSLLDDTSHAKASFERVANISKAIKKLQVLKRIPIISVSQMNRTKNDDGSQDTTQIGLSDRIGQDATSIIMLDKEEDELTKNTNRPAYKLTLNIVKARDGGDNKKLTYRADFNNGTFEFIPEGDNISDEDADELAQSYEVSDGTGVF